MNPGFRGAKVVVTGGADNVRTNGVPYRRSKRGLEWLSRGLTRAPAKELGPTIHINAICPGVIETEVGNTLTRSRGPALTKGICLGRLGTPRDVANLVAFLADSEPSFMTGQSIVLDGFQWIA
jgi:NAD(P)-dependent dehydrogenase (short-subunit alcohol dehydrogenase family)